MLYVVAFAYWDLEPKNFKVMALHSLDCLITTKFCLYQNLTSLIKKQVKVTVPDISLIPSEVNIG